MRIVVLFKTSFANSEGLNSQLIYAMLVTDETRYVNIVHYGLSTCHRVSRLVMAAEVYAQLHAAEIAILLQAAFR